MKKILLTIFVFLLLIGGNLSLFARPSFAQSTSPWYSQNPFEWYLKVYDESMSPPNEIFGERYTAAQVQWVTWSVLSTPVRLAETVVDEKAILCIFKYIADQTIDISDCFDGITKTATKILDFIVPNIKASNNTPVLALVFDSNQRSISGIQYTKNLLKKFSPVSEVQAQGYGYTGLTWLNKYWRGFRDMSYFLLVLVVIVLAFMIMFRVKISPQIVISVQSALPKIIIALLLITFSYAIAGFIIDLMYVVAGLFVILLKLAGFADAGSNNAWWMISGTGLGYSIAGGFWVLFVMLGYAFMFFIAALVATIATILGGLSIFGAVVGIIFMILGVFCLVIMLWYTIKIPYVLLKTLIHFYVMVITAPLQILAGTFTSNMGFGVWLKTIIADILVFPVTGLFFWFAWSTLFSSLNQSGLDIARGFWVSKETMWAPGIIGSAADMGGIIFLAISFSIMTLIPKIPNIIKQFMTGEKFQGNGLGETMTAASTVGGTAMSIREGIAKGSVGTTHTVFGRTIPTQRIVDRLKWLSYIPKP